MGPWRLRQSSPSGNNLYKLVGEDGYLWLGALQNAWTHGLSMCMLIVQVRCFGGVIRASRSFVVVLAFIAVWAIFSETFVKAYASKREDGTVHFPYGSLMQWPLRPVFYAALV